MDPDIDGELGLKVLHDAVNPTVDIVAVHGLGANPRYAWVATDDKKHVVLDKSTKERSIITKLPIVNFLLTVLYLLIFMIFAKKKKKAKDEEVQVNWLKDLLPKEIPHARILTFNYASKWHKNAPKQSRTSCAELFLFSLRDLRKEEAVTKKRPLIFIGHSFGGNVIEQMLVLSISREDFSFIAKATVGVVFLGTPHRGSECAKWGQLIAWSGEMLGLDTEDRIIKDLQKDSEVLKDVLHEFSLWLFRMSVPSVCFYEQYPTNYGAKVGAKWMEMVVDDTSACLDGHHKLPLKKDHIQLNKYLSPDDPSFQRVYPCIKSMAENSNEVVYNRYHPRPIILNDSDSEITDPDNMKCLSALYETNPPDDLAAIQRAKLRVKGTCEWLLLQKEYTIWVLSEKSQLLRLEGGPGIGKTVLASFLVQKLEERAQMSPYMTFAYYFCDNKNEKRRTAVSILRGLILQLLRQHKLFQYIQPDFKVQGNELFKNFEALWRILLKLLEDPKSGNVFLLIDALDECEELSRKDLLDALEKLFASLESPNQTRGPRKCKILITCRREPDIRRKLGKISTTLPVDTGKVNTDLCKFISSKVGEVSEEREWTTNLEDTVRETLINKAGGTFLWASLVLKELEKTDKDQVRDKLNKFPADLYDLYDTILSGVERIDEAKFILQFMVGARRPLTQRELAMAFVLNRGRGEDILPLEDQLDESKDIFAVCKQIVYLDEHDRTANLIHQSVKDYLLGDHLKKNRDLKQYYIISEMANLLIFQICWRYLSMNEFDQGNKIISRQSDNKLRLEYLSEEFLQRHCFLQYASQEWQEHAVAASSTLVSDYEFKKDTLDKASTLRDSWLLRAALEGHEAVVRLLLEKGADMDSKSESGQTPLSWAAREGHEVVVRLLLEKGADVDSKDSYYDRTPLSWAAEGGLEVVVQLLLKEGVNMDSKDDYYGRTPLSWAAEGGHEAAVQLLLEEGADVDSKPKSGQTPLSWAAGEGHELVVRLLLEKGADVDSKDSEYGQTSLSWAAERGHEAVVRLLLEKGADVDSKSNNSRTPLSWAAGGGHEAVVQLLLEKGADMDSKDSEHGRTPLSWAAERGHEAVVRLLLEKGADVDSKDSEHGLTPLSWAAGEGHEVVVRLLLEKGVDVDSKSKNGQTPLSLAARGGHEIVVRLLLEKGADVDSKSNDGQTPLSWAADRAHEAVVSLLAPLTLDS